MQDFIVQIIQWLFLGIVFSITSASANFLGLWRLRVKATTGRSCLPHVIEINLLGTLAVFLIGWLRKLDPWVLSLTVVSVWGITWLMSHYANPSWGLPDKLFLVLFILSEAFYLLHKLLVVASLQLDPFSVVVTLALAASEAFTLIACAHSVFDVVAAMNVAEISTASNLMADKDEFPSVSLHVPVCKEPPSVVIETLNALALLNYPNYEVIVVSNNTTDEYLWRPIEAQCRRLGFYFYHFDHLGGYKAGALNQALREANSDATLVGIVDSDDIVSPDFLRRVVPLFDDPEVGFVQTRQDYREWQSRPYLRGIYPLYRFFYDIVMVTRNTRNSVIFSGSMGLIRSRALREIGGWDEWCITEDAEASLRILQLGYQGIYINESFGFGLLPQTFGDMKRQWSRWMTGAAQIIRKHRLYNLLKPTRKTGLSVVQRWDYLIGGSMSFGALLMLTSTLFLTVAAALIVYSPQRFTAVFSPLTTSIAIFSYFLILTGMITVLAFKIHMGFPWGDSLSAFSTLLALCVTRGLAFLRAFTRREVPFHRTPKSISLSSWASAIASVREELVAGSFTITIGLATVLLVSPHGFPFGLLILLGWQMISYISALYSAIRSTLNVRGNRSRGR